MAKLKSVHPGEILREEFMGPLKLNPHRLALALRVPAPGIYEIVKEERAISTEMALRLARFFPHHAGILDESANALRPRSRPRQRAAQSGRRSAADRRHGVNASGRPNQFPAETSAVVPREALAFVVAAE